MLTLLYQTGTEFLTFYFFNMNTELSTFHQQKFRVFNKKHIVSSLLFKYSYFTQCNFKSYSILLFQNAFRYFL